MINVSITGGQKTRERLAATAARIKDLGPAYLRAGLVVSVSAQNRIRSHGDGAWPPAKRDPKNRKGQTIGSLLYRSGHLFRSLAQGDADHIQDITTGGLRTGTNVPYARALQEGTGELGPKGMPIRARSKKGKEFIRHGGIPARPYLFISDEDAGNIRNVFARYIIAGEA